MKFGNLIKCAAWIAALASVFACAKEVGPGYEEGLPVTSIKMSISAPGQDKIDISTKATEAVESAVEQIAIFFYKANDANAMPIVSEITPTFASNVGSNYQYNIVIPATDLEEMRSGKWYMYAVANYGKGFFPVDVNALKGLTRNQFLDYCITKENNALDILETSVLMSGKYCAAGKTYDQCDGSLDIKPGENKLDGIIRLRRSVAKITFKFVNGSHPIAGTTTTAHVTFKPESYGLYEYSRSCTLMERDWNDDIAYMGDLSVSEENRFHNGSDFPVTGSQFAFYMPENAQTRNVKGTPDKGWTYFNREERNSDGVENPTQEQYNTFKYAPKHGTFVAVKGTISIPEENYSGDVTYYIHLGNFTKSVDDFTVRRNYHYTYTITVNGVDNIIAEAKAEDSGEIQPGAEGNITHTTDAYLDVRLDSHYETVLLKVKADVDAGTYAVRVNSPYSKNVMVKSTDDPADFEAKKKNLDYGWIRFGRPAANKGYRSFPGVSNTTDVFGLIADLQSANTTKTYWSKDTYNGEAYYYTIAYVNEYYYEDKMNNAADKTAELKKFINADDRTMSVILGPNVFESKDGHSTYTDLTHGFFNISQRSIKTFYDLSVANPFGIEQIEETAATSNYKIDYSYSNRNNYDKDKSDTDNGYLNIPDRFTSGSSSWNSYISNGFYQSVALSNNYAVYQCLSRNRDEDGDGKIDANEMKWYLPAVHQCTYYWFGMNSLPEDARIKMEPRKTNNYWSSTSGFATWWAAEGSAYGAKEGTCQVRCVRSLKSYNDLASEVSKYDSNTRIVTMLGMDHRSVREAGTVTGEFDEHERGTIYDVLPSSFQIAKNNLDKTFTNDQMMKVVDANSATCSDYYEGTNGSDKGQWRVPNEKELTLILKWLRTDSNYGTTKNLKMLASRSYYQRHNSSDNMVYYIVGDSNDGMFITTSDQTKTGFKVRCVRDVVK